MIKFLPNYGFFENRLFSICKYCGGDNSRRHIVNEYNESFFTNLRDEFSNKVCLYLNKPILDLKGGLLEIYYKPKDKSIVNGLKILKEYVAKMKIA